MSWKEITGLSALTNLWWKKEKVDLTETEHALLKRFDEIKNKYNEDQLKAILEIFETSHNEENSRLDKIEAKANSLLGFTGIAATLVLGLAAISKDGNVVSLALRVGVGICFLISILLAIQVTQIGRYKFSRPNIDNLWDFTSKSDKFVWQEHAYDILYSYLINSHWINDKASRVTGAQIWFRNAVILLLLLSISTAFFPVNQVEQLQNPQVTLTSLPPTITATHTKTPIPTPTITPSATVVLTTPTP